VRVGEDLRAYLRLEKMPSMWCPGCGHGNVAAGIVRALERIDADLDRVVLVGGIGCATRTTFYVRTNAMHTTHGRALAFATGVKMARPELTVIAVMGDGDALAIGGNHLIHACRRNIDVTTVLFNNAIYGMTGGQLAPTAPSGSRSTTSALGSIEQPFDAVALALAAGASYVARTTTFDFDEMPRLIEAAIRHPGFALVEVLTQCPTYFGRLNQLGDPLAMLEHERDITTPIAEITRDDLVGTVATGVFREEVRPEYSRRYAELVARAVNDEPR
jgi:2-oxoglutarate ferredoxin oxidoreductase subunit beta